MAKLQTRIKRTTAWSCIYLTVKIDFPSHITTRANFSSATELVFAAAKQRSGGKLSLRTTRQQMRRIPRDNNEIALSDSTSSSLAARAGVGRERRASIIEAK